MSEIGFLTYILQTLPEIDFDDMYQEHIREDLKKLWTTLCVIKWFIGKTVLFTLLILHNYVKQICFMVEGSYVKLISISIEGTRISETGVSGDCKQPTRGTGN